jgi:hypothetical protein
MEEAEEEHIVLLNEKRCWTGNPVTVLKKQG